MCEHSKKLLTAIWLHLRQDGFTIGRAGRDLALSHVKRELAKAGRYFEPKVYLEELPGMEKVASEFPELYHGAYVAKSRQSLS